MRKKLILLAAAVILLALGIIYLPYHCNCNATPASAGATSTLPSILVGRQTEKLTFGTTTITAVIADTDALREQGLSGATTLPANTGMIFVFDTPQMPGFWMKDMLYNLDMVWISADMKIVSISKDVTVASYPQVFFPTGNILYVLEVPAGFSDTHGLFAGEKLSIGQ